MALWFRIPYTTRKNKPDFFDGLEKESLDMQLPMHILVEGI